MWSVYHRQHENPLPWIVIEGGPGSGKSGVTDALRKSMPNIHFQKEAASAIFGTGVKAPNQGPYLQEFNHSFGKIIRHLETIAEIHAQSVGAEAVVFDRGLAGLLAYLPGEGPEFELLMGLMVTQAYARVGLVIYLEMPPEEIFLTHLKNNPNRYEKTYEEALATAERTRNAWRNHPNFQTVDSTVLWQTRVDAAAMHIAYFLAQLRHSS